MSSDLKPTTADAGVKTGKERGPIEEVIARRLRPLVKKIQRIKGYASQPVASLNADQKTALATLPALEAACRELEELTKQVEEAELVNASREREVRESEARKFNERVEAKAIELQASLSTPLSLFLRLYGLLHPARSGDHEHLTFTRLVLPSNLRDEVTATDVLRVGRMYDDLLTGGAASQVVLGSLIAGPTGVDEENDHVQQLLVLVAQPDSELPEPSEAGAPPASVAVEPALSVQGTIDVDNDSGVPTLSGSPISSSPNPNSNLTLASLQTSGALPVGFGQPSRGTPLNFLQADELAPPAVEEPVEPAPVIPVEPSIDVEEPTPAPQHAPLPPTIDWSAEDADDADDLVAAEHIRGAFASSGMVTPAIQTVEETTPAFEIAVAQEITAESTELAPPIDAPTSAESSVPVASAESPVVTEKPQGQGQGGQGKRGGRKPFRGSGKPKESKDATTPAVNGHAHGHGAPEVDADGFEVVGGRRPSQPVRGRGRGGFSDRGRGAGRGRGGAQREGRQGNGPAGPKANGGGNEDKRKDAPLTPVSAQEKKPGPTAQSKPSIYKAVQPTGPVSAPIF